MLSAALVFEKSIGWKACYVFPNTGKLRLFAFLTLVKLVVSGSRFAVVMGFASALPVLHAFQGQQCALATRKPGRMITD